MNLKEINLFEAFAGIGSQHKAFSNILTKYDAKLNLAGISEWNIYSLTAYMIVNNIKYEKIGSSQVELSTYLSQFNYSIDGKNPKDDLQSVPYNVLEKVFFAQHKLNNTPNIQNLSGETLSNKNVNVFTYSFPCQDLSLAGKRAGMSKGEGTRSGLLWEVERILNEIGEKERKKLPRFLLMENVPQIISHLHIKDYNNWKDYLSSMGYTTFDGCINPMGFKFPQSRNRFFAISILDYNGPISKDKEIFEIINEHHYGEYKTYPKLKDMLKLNYDGEKNIKYLLEALNATPNHTASRIKMFESERQLTNEKGKVPRVTKTNFPHCKTITTKQDRWHNAGVIRFDRKRFSDGSKSTHRFITPREAFLLMGYTEKSFEALSQENLADAELYKMAGNSIVVPVLELIFETFILSDYMYKENNDK